MLSARAAERGLHPTSVSLAFVLQRSNKKIHYLHTKSRSTIYQASPADKNKTTATRHASEIATSQSANDNIVSVLADRARTNLRCRPREQ